MITNHEKLTTKLNAEEITLARLIKSFLKQKHNTQARLISGKDIVYGYQKLGHKITGVRLRKIVNYLRSVESEPILATNRGYWYCKDKEQIKIQIISLKDREMAIREARLGLESLLK